jgi:hypothetical protein
MIRHIRFFRRRFRSVAVIDHMLEQFVTEAVGDCHCSQADEEAIPVSLPVHPMA